MSSYANIVIYLIQRDSFLTFRLFLSIHNTTQLIYRQYRTFYRPKYKRFCILLYILSEFPRGAEGILVEGGNYSPLLCTVIVAPYLQGVHVRKRTTRAVHPIQ